MFGRGIPFAGSVAAAPESPGSPSSSNSGPVPEETGRSRKRIRAQWIPVLGAIAVALIVLGLVVIPVPHPFSLKVSSFYPQPVYQSAGWEGWVNFPTLSSGSHVSGSWSSDQGALVTVNITDQTGQIYSAKGASGSFSFTSPGVWAQVLVYAAQAGVNVSVSGTYSSPEWSL